MSTKIKSIINGFILKVQLWDLIRRYHKDDTSFKSIDFLCEACPILARIELSDFKETDFFIDLHDFNYGFLEDLNSDLTMFITSFSKKDHVRLEPRTSPAKSTYSWLVGQYIEENNESFEVLKDQLVKMVNVISISDEEISRHHERSLKPLCTDLLFVLTLFARQKGL